MRHVAHIAAFVAIIVATTVGSAGAAPSAADKQRAAQSFEIGKAAFARGDFPAAAAAFEQAALYVPHPTALLDAAESWQLAENPTRAAQLYDRVLDTPGLEAEHRDVATKQLAKIERKVGTLNVRAPTNARIEVDDREETSARVRVAPGAHKIRMTNADGAQTQSIVVAGGETKAVDFVTKVEPVKPAPIVEARPEPTPSHGPPLGTWISFGAAAIAGGATVYFGVKTLGAKSTFTSQPTNETLDGFKSVRLATNVSLGLCVAAAAVGGVLWYVASKEPAKSGLRLDREGLRW